MTARAASPLFVGWVMHRSTMSLPPLYFSGRAGQLKSQSQKSYIDSDRPDRFNPFCRPYLEFPIFYVSCLDLGKAFDVPTT
jgi:hypothetical protein